MKSADNWPVDKRKEAGHYSGLNENWRSKTFDAHYSLGLHTLNCTFASNNKERVTHLAGLACHQLWLQHPKQKTARRYSLFLQTGFVRNSS